MEFRGYKYSLTVASTSGGSLIKPAAGTSTYNGRVRVPLAARPDNGFRRVRWIGDVHTVANVNAATTMIAMYGNYVITAAFPLNWPLIGGTAGSVAVAAGLTFLLLRKKKAARTRKRGPRKAARRER